MTIDFVLAKSADPVQTQMKCRIMRHFIWVFTDCQNIRMGPSSLQRVNVENKGQYEHGHSHSLVIVFYFFLQYSLSHSMMCRQQICRLVCSPTQSNQSFNGSLSTIECTPNTGQIRLIYWLHYVDMSLGGRID